MSQTRRPGTSGSAAGGVTPGLAFSSTVNPSIETTVGLVDPPRSVEGERLVQTLRLDALGHAATDYYPNLQDLSITRPGTSSSPALSATARSTGAIGAGFSSVDPLGTRRSRPASIGQLIGANLKRPAVCTLPTVIERPWTCHSFLTCTCTIIISVLALALLLFLPP